LKATCGKNKTADFTEKGLGLAMLCLLKSEGFLAGQIAGANYVDFLTNFKRFVRADTEKEGVVASPFL